MRGTVMLVTKNINKKLTRFQLNNISFHVEKGDYLVVLGPSGAGKTVLLEILAGVQKQQSGSILLNGTDVSESAPEMRNIGLLYQHYMLFPHMTVRKNISFSLQVKRKKKEIIAQQVSHYAGLLQIDHLLDRYPDNLSGGEKQRVALARALAMNPQLLLLDEPFASVDSNLKRRLIEVLKNLHKQFNLTVIHVTHDINEALYLANKIAIIQDGAIVQFGPKDSVFKNPANTFVADFLGYKNIFKGVIVDREYFSTNDIRIHLDAAYEDRESVILIPPESIILSPRNTATSARNSFEGNVADIIHKNGFYEIIIEIGIRLSVYITHDSFNSLMIENGMRIHVLFKATAVKIY